MRTALICAICFFCGAALFAPTKQLFNIGTKAGGPYAMRSSQLWSIQVSESEGYGFTVPQYSASVPSMVVTTITNQGGDQLEFRRSDGTWAPVIQSYKPLPAPGLRLAPGTYRLITGGFARISGYYAPLVNSHYPGDDYYPNGTKLWSAHPIFEEPLEFDVPPGSIYVVTFAVLPIERETNGEWEVYGCAGLGEEGHALPGVALQTGHYRITSGSPLRLGACGYISTEN